MTEKILHAAFLPFGEITEVQIPIDFEQRNLHLYYWTHPMKKNTEDLALLNSSQLRYTDLFCVLLLTLPQDAAAALDNMVLSASPLAWAHITSTRRNFSVEPFAATSRNLQR
jgi:hypothetical protein